MAELEHYLIRAHSGEHGDERAVGRRSLAVIDQADQVGQEVQLQHRLDVSSAARQSGSQYFYGGNYIEH